MLQVVIGHRELFITLARGPRLSQYFSQFSGSFRKGPLEDDPVRAEIFCHNPADGCGGSVNQNSAGCFGVLRFDFPLPLTFILMISPCLGFAIVK